MTRVRWEFPHPAWDATCDAEFDGAVLVVNATTADGYFGPEEVMRTCAGSREIAYRELRAFGADKIDLDRSEAVL